MFVVGRKASGTTVVVLRQPALSPIPGPWTLRVVVAAS